MLALAVAALGVAPGAKPRPPLRATAALVSVPILWGTYAPVAKTLLLETNAPATLSNFATHGVGAISLLSLLAVQRATRGKAAPKTSSASRGRTLRASCELGCYLWLGQLLQLLGLASTSATINALLVQASVIFVPLLDAYAARSQPPSTDGPRGLARWAPSLLALSGVALVSGSSALIVDGSTNAAGVTLSLLAAVCYSVHTHRLSSYADVGALEQASGQLLVTLGLDALVLAAAAALHACGTGALGGLAAKPLLQAVLTPALPWLSGAAPATLRSLALGAAWNGVATCALTTWAMSFAQKTFAASTAALAYALEPCFAIGFASILLHESATIWQLAGGALVVLSNLLASIL